MKKAFSFYLIVLSSFCLLNFAFGQAGEWMWIHGSQGPYSGGSPGTMGMPSATNEPPALYEPCEWTDLNGNYWMFGGVDGSGDVHGQLWKYDTLLLEWTWISGLTSANDAGIYGTQGMAAATNRPPARGYGFASWTDLNGNLWMFGGDKQSGGAFSDLWMYNIGTGEWTWMKGPNTTNGVGVYGTQQVPNILNNPGSRWECAAAWTDNNGDLWLFGGLNYSVYNDLWRFNIATNTWTWMKGSQANPRQGIYGTKGLEDTANCPGSREAHTRWKDKHGNLWLFGGSYTNFSVWQQYNDLWRFNTATDSWTWMSGDSVVGAIGSYGTQCITSPNNKPGSRLETRAAWTDANGNFWMYGGSQDGFSNNQYNDLWMYCVTSNQWTWENGDTLTNFAAYYGTINVAGPANTPGGRGGSIGWTDKKGTLYLFGGTFPVTSGIVPYNDLWKFSIDSTCGTCAQAIAAHFTSSDTVFCSESGKCISFTDHSSGNPTSWQWTFTGAIPDSSTNQNPDSICYYTPGTYPVTLVVYNSSGMDSITVSSLIVLTSPPPPPTITVSGDTLFSSHGNSYQWYFNGSPIPGSTDSFYVCSQQSGTFAVMITEGTGCNALSNGVFDDCTTGINQLSAGFNELVVFPNPALDVLTIQGKWLTANSTLTIYNVLGEKMLEEKILQGNEVNINIKWLPAGLYFIQIQNEKEKRMGKFVKE